MKSNVINRKTIIYYFEKHPLAKRALLVWYNEMVKYKFSSFNDLKKVYGNASIVNNQRIVFNIKENDYRLVVSVISEEMLVTQFGLVRINSMIKLM